MNTLRFFTFILALSLFGTACNQKQERPGGFQTELKRDSVTAQNGGFKDLVADYESRDRLVWQNPDLVIRMLGDLSYKTVADLGAGTGFFAFRLVPKAQKVLALEIDQRFINYMDSVKVLLPTEFRNRFEARLAATNDSRLKNEEADAVIIVNTYMYIENRVAYMSLLRKGVKKGGKVLIVDYKDKAMPVGPATNIKVPLSTVQRELKEAGFKLFKADDTSLDYQYIVIATNEN